MFNSIEGRKLLTNLQKYGFKKEIVKYFALEDPIWTDSSAVTEFIQLRSKYSKVRVSIKLVSVVGETEGRVSCGEENESIRASNMNTQKFGK